MIKKYGSICMGLVLLMSCDTTRIYEDFEEIPQGWSLVDTIQFDVAYNPATAGLIDLTTQFRCAITYPYSNLYYYLIITDSRDSALLSKLEEVQFFDAKTGKPLGDGLGDLYHREDLVVTGLSLPTSDTLTVSMIQYMRLDTLRGIDRVGLRVNTQVED